MTGSSSGSCDVTVTVSVSSVSGADWSIATESTTGAALPTTAVSEAPEPFSVPSFGVTVTTTVCPLSPLPASDRSNVSVRAVVVVV